MKLRRRDWAWLAGFFACLLLVFVTGRVAYEVNAFGPLVSRYVRAVGWAVSQVLYPLAAVLGLVALVADKGRDLLVHVVNSRSWRIVVMGLSVPIAILFIVVALRDQKVWTCAITKTTVHGPERPRCPDETFVRMRSFELRVVRASATPPSVTTPPTLIARSRDRERASVALESPRRLCGAGGPDNPVRGESRLVLASDCGADGTYLVSAHVCEMIEMNGELGAAIELEILEPNAQTIECE